MPELHPSLVLLAAAAVVAVVPRRWAGALCVAAAAGALAVVVGLEDGVRQTYEVYGLELTPLRVDGLARPFALVFAAFTVLAALYGWSIMGRLERASALVTAAAGLGVVLAGDLLTLFFFWELKVSSATLLIGTRRRARSGSAGFRYLGVHLLGGVTLLGGVAWHLASTGSLAFDGPIEVSGAGVLLLAGFLVSAAAPPLNAWLADAYPESTVAGTVFLSAFTTKSAVYALARGFPGTEVVLWLGVAMAIYGVVFAMLENDIRRLLCFHIVSQVGFMVAAVGVGGTEGVNGATAMATAHVLYKGLLLMGVGAVLHATGRSRATDLGGLARVLPWVLGLYLVGAASISGVPLFSGFAAKELAIGAVGAETGVAMWLLKFASIGTFVSVALKLPSATWFGAARASVPSGEQARALPVTMYAAMGLAAAANVVVGVAPDVLLDQMPTPVALDPFTATKVVDQLQLLGLAAVGFVLVRSRLTKKATTSVDTDWLYRELPDHLRRSPAWARAVAGGERLRALPDAALAATRRGPLELFRTASAAGLAPGWVLGSSVVVMAVVVLGWSVLP